MEVHLIFKLKDNKDLNNYKKKGKDSHLFVHMKDVKKLMIVNKDQIDIQNINMFKVRNK